MEVYGEVKILPQNILKKNLMSKLSHPLVLWITPTGACADTLRVEDLVMCSIDGSRGELASFDVDLHIEVYKQNTKACAVLHNIALWLHYSRKAQALGRT